MFAFKEAETCFESFRQTSLTLERYFALVCSTLIASAIGVSMFPESSTLIPSAFSFSDSPEYLRLVKDRVQAHQGRKAKLDRQAGELRAKVAKATTAEADTRKQLQSVQELIEGMDGIEGQERVALRLSLRGQLRRLLDEIQVWPGPGRVTEEYGLFFKSGEWRGLTVAKDGRVLVMDGKRERKRIPMFFHPKCFSGLNYLQQ